MGDGRLDVLHVVESTLAGIRRHLFDLIEGLRALGLRQGLAYSARRADVQFLQGLPHLESNGIRCIEVDMLRSVAPVADARAIVALATQIRRLRPRIVHCHSSKAGGIGRLAALAAPGVGVVYTPNASAIHLSPVYLWIERVLGHLRTDVLVAVSRSEHAELLSARLVPDGRLVEVDSGVDASAVLAEAKQGVPGAVPGHTIVCSGRMTAQKEPFLLLDASARVLAAHPDARFVWVGDGELRAGFERRAKQLGVDARWTVTGWLDNPLPWLAAASVFVLPSAYESFGYVTLEAMILGRPVVATDVSGTRDLVVHGVTGLLVPRGDAQGLAAALNRMLLDSAFARSCGEAGAVRSSPFSRERMAAETLNVYQRVKPRL